MTDLSEAPGELSPPEGDLDEPEGDLDEAVFRSLLEEQKPLEHRALLAVKELLDTITRELGEEAIRSAWDPKEDISKHTADYLDNQQKTHRTNAVSVLSAWAGQLDADGQIRMLVYLWKECFDLWDKSLTYRTIEAVADATHDVVDGEAGAGARNAWQQDTWRAVGAALRVMYLDGLAFKETNLSCAVRVRGVTSEATILKLNEIRDDLHRAERQLEDQPGAAWRQIQPCVSYMRKYVDQTALFYGVIEKMAYALVEFESWLASARPAGGRRSADTESLGLWPLSLDDAPRDLVVAALESVAEVKDHLSSHTLSEIEPWEQMLEGLRDLMSADPHRELTPSVLIPRQVWVRYCYPFAVQNDDRKRAERLLHAPYEADADDPEPETSQHPLSFRLGKELDRRMKIGEPEDLAETYFFQGDEQGGHFGGIRIRLPDLVFVPDFLDSVDRRYEAWLDLNRMGNFCLCVQATEPLKDISPPRLYRALRAGTPFVVGERVRLATKDVGEGADAEVLAWDNLHTYAQCMIKAAANAYFAAIQKHPDASAGPANYVQGNLHEVVIVQTDAPIAEQSEEIARRLDGAVGGRILLRSIQRAAATLDEWTRFPPLQHARASAVVAVPEIGYAGDWFVHTGETTVFGIVAVPEWFRDVYPEAAQFASSWSPVLKLWNRQLQDALKGGLKDLDDEHDGATGNESNKLRYIEQQVRYHLAEINSDDLCATLAYRRFLDSVLEAVGIGRLEKELQTQLQAAEQLTDYFYQQEEKRATKRRDILLFLIALLGVFSLADYLALLDTTDYHGHVGFIRLSQDGRWQDLLVLIIFVVALILGMYVLFGARSKKFFVLFRPRFGKPKKRLRPKYWLRPGGETRKRNTEREKPAA